MKYLYHHNYLSFSLVINTTTKITTIVTSLLQLQSPFQLPLLFLSFQFKILCRFIIRHKSCQLCPIQRNHAINLLAHKTSPLNQTNTLKSHSTNTFNPTNLNNLIANSIRLNYLITYSICICYDNCAISSLDLYLLTSTIPNCIHSYAYV